MRIRQREAITPVCVFVAIMTITSSAFGADLTINPDSRTYDFHPATTSTKATNTHSAATWFAWHGYRNGKDQLFARRVGADGAMGNVEVLTDQEATPGPPVIVGDTDDSLAAVWSRKKDARWQIMVRRRSGGEWTAPTVVSDIGNDAIYPAAISLGERKLLVAWSSNIAGKWRVRCRRIVGDKQFPIEDISPERIDAFRPVLVSHRNQVWGFWDQYRQKNYSVQGRVVYPSMMRAEQVSPEGEYCLTPSALSHPSGLHVAWLRKTDVVGGPGVVSQWHSLHGAVRRDSGWRQITTPSGSTTAADLTHGLMAKIAPRPVATGGYLGPRVRAKLLADNDRVWLLWERKSDHRGSTPTVSGDLVARPSRDGKWQPAVVLKQGKVDYHVIDPPVVQQGKVRILASPLPRYGIRRYEVSEVALADAQPFEQDEWTGWRPIELPIKKELTPRRQVSSNNKTWKLFWADLHCHNGLTADAEGEPDEMHFYARDRAALDVVVFTNNDFYNVPLTQYDFELGNLFAKIESANIGATKPRTTKNGKTKSPLETNQPSQQRKLLSIPGFEWTSRIPGVATAKLSDSGNWLPPYRNRSYPNHRSVIYPPSSGPLVHFTEVGNDIARLNEAVARAGGITLSQHSAFKLSGHPVEVGFELTSGWSNYIASRPKLFHAPLNRGARLGFTANGDTHRRAPGLSGALTGIYAEELTAESILDALRNRRCFATSGSRIFLDARAGDALMGAETQANEGSVALTLHAIGTRPIVNARLIRDGETIHEIKGNGTLELKAHFEDNELTKGTHWYYWRVTQAGHTNVLPGNLMPAHGSLAWSSPNWVIVD